MGQVSRSCPVCTHHAVDLVYDNAMAPIGAHNMSYTVGRCRKCGFLFAASLADDQTFQSYYQSVSKYDVAAKVSKLDELRIDAAVRICRGRIPCDAMIVDLGCGYGALLSRLKLAGWNNLHGVDPAPNSAERARELFALEGIHCGTMADAHRLIALDQADLICVTAVLEHLPHLRDDVANLLAKIKPGCRILVEVPALEGFSGLDREPFGEFSLEHIQFFSALSLDNLFGSLGARPLAREVVDLTAVNASDSLFGLFEWTGAKPAAFEPVTETIDVMLNYVRDSMSRLSLALARIPAAPIVVYGAGSHTARLLPYLERQFAGSVVAVVDNNPNLLGKTIGRWPIQSPSMIRSMPEAHILVSSFRFQNEIAASLGESFANSLVLLYD